MGEAEQYHPQQTQARISADEGRADMKYVIKALRNGLAWYVRFDPEGRVHWQSAPVYASRWDDRETAAGLARTVSSRLRVDAQVVEVAA